MVRLKLTKSQCANNPFIDFNPTMVRLKLWRKECGWIIRNKFQSHNGSIKTEVPLNPEYPLVPFQSHNGSIKTYKFNQSFVIDNIFQSHNGSIKTDILRHWQLLIVEFQSHNGSIKTPL